MRGSLLAFLAGSMAACTFSPDVSTDEATILKAGAHDLASRASGPLCNSSRIAVAAGHATDPDPVSIVVKSDGVYVTTSEVLVESKGLFFSTDPAFKPIQGSDPAFTKVIPGVYEFHIKG